MLLFELQLDWMWATVGRRVEELRVTYRMMAEFLGCATGEVVEPVVCLGRGAGLGWRGERELNV